MNYLENGKPEEVLDLTDFEKLEGLLMHVNQLLESFPREADLVACRLRAVELIEKMEKEGREAFKRGEALGVAADKQYVMDMYSRLRRV